jgi:hypothetical protein
MSQDLPSSLQGGRFTNLRHRKPGLRRPAPIIILCSNASVYRAYARGTGKRAPNSDNGLVHFVSKP